MNDPNISYLGLFNQLDGEFNDLTVTNATIDNIKLTGKITTDLPASQTVVTDTTSSLSTIVYTPNNISTTFMFRDSSGNCSLNQLTVNYLIVNNTVALYGLKITPASDNTSVFSVTNSANNYTVINIDTTNLQTTFNGLIYFNGTGATNTFNWLFTNSNNHNLLIIDPVNSNVVFPNLSALTLAQFDSNNNLIGNNSLPSGCSATSMTLTDPIIDGTLNLTTPNITNGTLTGTSIIPSGSVIQLQQTGQNNINLSNGTDVTTAGMLSITNPSLTSSNVLNIIPGYKGSTQTDGWVTYDLPGVGNQYFWDNVEISNNLQVDATLTVDGTSTFNNTITTNQINIANSARIQFNGTSRDIYLESSTSNVANTNALRITNGLYDSLAIITNYKGATANTNAITYDIPGMTTTGLHYFTNNVEVANTLSSEIGTFANSTNYSTGNINMIMNYSSNYQSSGQAVNYIQFLPGSTTNNAFEFDNALHPTGRLYIMPGFKQWTPTDNYCSLFLNGAGTFYFWDSVEISSNLLVDGNSTISGNVTGATFNTSNFIQLINASTPTSQPIILINSTQNVASIGSLCVDSNPSKNAPLLIIPNYKGASQITGCITYDIQGLTTTGLHYFTNNMQVANNMSVGGTMNISGLTQIGGTSSNPFFYVNPSVGEGACGSTYNSFDNGSGASTWNGPLRVNNTATFNSTINYNASNASQTNVTGYTGVAMPTIIKLYYTFTVTTISAGAQIGPAITLPSGVDYTKVVSIRAYMNTGTTGSYPNRLVPDGYAQFQNLVFSPIISNNVIYLYSSSTFAQTSGTMTFYIWIEHI